MKNQEIRYNNAMVSHDRRRPDNFDANPHAQKDIQDTILPFSKENRDKESRSV